MTTERLEHIGSAATGIAHDINNQLQLIVNHLSLSDVDGALAAVQQCSALTSRLLAFSRGEKSEPEPIHLGSFIRRFAASLRLPAGVQLVLDVAETPCPVAANPDALSRALSNLVSNALTAMKSEGILRISAHAGAVDISDSGPGVPVELATKIFEPFFTTKGEQGTGLGLAIVRQIMRQHGGSVTLRSTPGEGATFRLQFRSC